MSEQVKMTAEERAEWEAFKAEKAKKAEAERRSARHMRRWWMRSLCRLSLSC